MKRILFLLPIVSTISILEAAKPNAMPAKPMPAKHNMAKMPTDPKAELNTGLRKLWSDHVIWTRDYITAATSDAPNAKASLNRLMKNQEDLGNAIGKYYGKEAGAKTTALLKDHIKIAGDVVAAAKAGDKNKLANSDKQWHKNADDIAIFFSSANPNWSKDDLQNMLYEHLKLTTDEAVAKLHKDWNKDIAAFDMIYNQALGMADTFTDGIIKQFPEKFQTGQVNNHTRKATCLETCKCNPCTCETCNC